MSTNATCFKEVAPQQSPPLFQNGSIVFQAHHVGWIVSGFFTMVACIASFWLINKHLQWYTNKREQRYIVRILFMVPIYAVVSFASYIFWNHATPILLFRDCYESTVLTAFFYLLLMYLSHDPDEQREAFRKNGISLDNDRRALREGKPPRKWMLPLGFVKKKPQDGYYFLQIMKWAILQYCVIRPVTTLIAVTLNYIGLYCEDSWSPRWGQVYITTVVSISVSIAMYCLVQLYVCVSEPLQHQKPLLKLLAIKAVVFLTFWQSSALSLLTMFGWVKDTKYMTADDINNGISALLETFEMMCFAFLHIRAFTYKVYRPPYNSAKEAAPERTPRLKSLGHAMDFRETWREIRDGLVYMVAHSKGVETDVKARRVAHREELFGYSAAKGGDAAEVGGQKTAGYDEYGDLRVGVDVEVEVVDAHGRRRWLPSEDYGYRPSGRREKSEGLEAQIETELNKRGYSIRESANAGLGRYDRLNVIDEGHPVNHERTKSWWRNVYDRISGSQHASGPIYSDDEGEFSAAPRQHKSRSRSRHRSKHSDARPLMYDDLPPPSAIRTFRGQSKNKGTAMPTVYYDPYSTPAAGPSSPPPHARASYTGLPSPPRYSNEVPAGAMRPQMLSVPSGRPMRSDSMLQRVFPHSSANSDVTSEVRSIDVTTAQSHRHRSAQRPPRLAPGEIVAHPSARRLPVLTDERQLPPTPSHRRDSAHYRTPMDSPTASPPLSPIVSPRRFSREGGLPYSAASPPLHSPASPTSPPRRQGPKIVLPAPLAPPLQAEPIPFMSHAAGAGAAVQHVSGGGTRGYTPTNLPQAASRSHHR